MKNDIKKMIEAFKKRTEGEKLPLFTLTEFFENNTEEESIAPNQWGYGRPTLAELWKHLCKIEKRYDVAWIRVTLHDDTDVDDYSDDVTICEVLGTDLIYEIHGESIVICTSAPLEEMEQVVDCEWLGSGSGIGSFFEADRYTEIPEIPNGYRALTLFWD